MSNINLLHKKIIFLIGLFIVTDIQGQTNKDDYAELKKEITDIHKQSEEMEKQISSLKLQVKQLKMTANYYKTKAENKNDLLANKIKEKAKKKNIRLLSTPPVESLADKPPTTHLTYQEIQQKNNQQNSASEKLSLAETNFVVVAPYYGTDTTSVITIPSFNQDIKMLQKRQSVTNQTIDKYGVVPKMPLVELSGRLEGQISAQAHNNDINLSGAEIDIASYFNRWTLGLLAFAYDNTTTSPVRINNSRMYLDRGFITLGNLNSSPFYGTIGQRYVPFGQYNSFMISGPLTEAIGRTAARSILIGYQHPGSRGLYSSIYAFRGDSQLVDSNNVINNFGISTGYEIQNDTSYIDFGVDAIRNIADAKAMQNNGSGSFSGFSMNNSTEQLQHLVPGIDIHGKFNLKSFTLLFEYTGALQAFDDSNLTFNAGGAKPRAFDAQAAYDFSLANHPGSVALGFGRTYDALAIQLPKERFSATVNYTFLQNTITSFEFQHNINYPSSDMASGQGVTVSPPAQHCNDAFIARLGVYF